MFCMKFILHEILKYELNNLHVLIFLHVVCFYFACYSSILVGLSQYYESAVPRQGFRKFGGRGEFRQFFKFQVGEELSGSRWFLCSFIYWSPVLSND